MITRRKEEKGVDEKKEDCKAKNYKNNDMINDLKRLLKALAKSHAVDVLFALENNIKSQGELAIQLRIDKAVVHYRLKELCEIGLVTEDYNPDRKLLEYSLTNKGLEILTSLKEMREIAGELFSPQQT